MRTMIIFFICLTVGIKGGHACTTFRIHTDKHLVVGKNFDFYTGIGHVVVNKRSVQKSAYPLPPEKVLQWTARYGSVTFNQMGKEFPYGGINEKGLVIEIMWLAESVYPAIDDRFGLTELQWIQYQLDNFSTVAEVLASDSRVRISKMSRAPVHIMVCDAKGNKVTIEYVNGKLISHTGSSLPHCVLTNNTYDQSLRHVNNLIRQGQEGHHTFTTTSLDRFAEASLLVKNYKQEDVVAYAFDILSTTFQPNFTRWSIVYDIRNMAVHYRTIDNADTRMLRIADIDFSCKTPASFVDIREDMKDGKLVFKPYSPSENKALVLKSFSEVDFLQGTSPAEVDVIAKYPDTVTCRGN